MRLLTYIQTRHQISRRNFVSLVSQGCVFVNDKKIDAYTQDVQDGDCIAITSPKYTIKEVMQIEQKSSKIILFNKPKGYVASKSDPHNKTIYDILPPEFKNYYYIWRLDKDSHWLLLLTDDPGLVNEYEHPKHAIEKEYVVEIDRSLHHADLKKALHWVIYEDESLKALSIKVFKKPYMYTIILNEGKKRHIRRMFQVLWYRVLDLKRVREGKYSLWNLKTGEWKTI